MAGSYFFDSQLAKKNPMDYVKDKKLSANAYINYMAIRLQKMFKYTNLPETIPREMLEYYLMINGTCFISEYDGNLYAFTVSFGGEPDAYYRPTRYVVANPALKMSKDFDIKSDGVLIRNDSIWQGLYPLMARYASLMAENILTLRSADVMLRVIAMLTAPDDKTRIAAEAYLKKLEDGEFGVIAENRFFEGIKMQSPPSNNGSYLTQFIELHQYLKGSFYNEIGLNANFNMKREALGDGESSLNEDSLLPLCDEMLRCRQEDIKKVNEKFGTDITVEFDSSWAQNVIEKELTLDKMRVEASQLAEEPEESDEASQLAEEPEESDDASQLAEETEETGEPEESDGTSQLAEETEESGEPEESDDASQLAEETEETAESEESDDASQLAENPEINITIINGDNIEISDEDEKGDDEDNEELSTG